MNLLRIIVILRYEKYVNTYLFDRKKHNNAPGKLTRVERMKSLYMLPPRSSAAKETP